ncbi:hypothetical protein Q5530_11410 [Saccharothrix sp. BKS2]
MPPALQISAVSEAIAIGLAESESRVVRCPFPGAPASSAGRAATATPGP